MTQQTEKRRPAANGTAQQQAHQAESTVTHPSSARKSSDQPSQLTAGDALAWTDVMRYRRGVAWTDAEVAHIVQLAYETGRMHAAGEDLAETIACWREFAEPRATREERIARRLATMGPSRPPRFDDPTWPAVAVPGAPGVRLGPKGVTTSSDADPVRVVPRFPSPREQSAWLSAEDVDFSRRYAAKAYR